jgi:RNA polymerase sigma-70 factor (ECF subfamily)
MVMLTATETNFSAMPAGLRTNEASRVVPRKAAFPVPETPDESLIKAIASGDRHAMELLYARHSVRVYRFAIRITGDATLAEDIVSEVFIDVWRNAAGFEARSKASTWLLAIARNKSLSLLRSRRDEQIDDETAVEFEDPADDAEISIQKKDRSAAIQRCLSQLSAVHREVVDLVYYHEHSVEEVALIVGVPPSTVKTRMFYARRRMGEFLNAAGFDGA